MSEKQIWHNFGRLILVIAVIFTAVTPFALPINYGFPLSFSMEHASAANSTYDWFCTNGYGEGWDISTAATYYAPVLGDFDHREHEVAIQVAVNDDYTWKKLYVKVMSNTSNDTVVISSRINGGDGNQTVTIPAGTTGIFTDAVNTDTLADGDLISYKIVVSGNGTINIPYISSIVNGSKPIIAVVNASTALSSIGDGDITYYAWVGFASSQATDNETTDQYTIRTLTTLSNMRIYVDSNNLNGTANFTLRKNGVAGNQIIAVSAGQTGSFTDAVNTDTISAGDEVAYEIAAGGSSGTIKISMAQILSDSTAQQVGLSHGSSFGTIVASATKYFSLGGNIASESSTENSTQQDLQGSYTGQNLFVNVQGNTTDGDSTIRVRKNGSNTDIVVTVPANTKGLFEDTTHTANFTDGDMVNFMVTGGSGSGTLWISVLGMELVPEGDSGISVPTVTTQSASGVEETTSTGNGNITATGGENCTERGAAYDTDSGWPYSSNVTSNGDFGTGNFTSSLTGLTQGELYYASAFAGNSAGYGHGDEVTFLTKPNGATSFSDTSTTNTSVSMSWTNGSGMDYVEIRYQESEYVSDNASGTLGYWGSGSSTTINSLSANTTYYFSLYTHVTEGGLWNTADTVGQDTAYTSNPITGDMSGVFPGILNSISVSSLIVFIIMMIAGLSQIYPIFHKGYKVISNVKR